MSCEKIKMHLPQLCKENKDCAKINNPLSYYSRKKWLMNKNGTQNGDSGGKSSPDGN
jgi:DNA primase large subunit